MENLEGLVQSLGNVKACSKIRAIELAEASTYAMAVGSSPRNRRRSYSKMPRAEGVS
jgi:hypothetical protein